MGPGPKILKYFPFSFSAEHEILPANKEQIIDKYRCFLLSLAECEIFSAYEYENANISWHFHIYQQRKFHAQLS